jgi:type IV secretory pathway VirB10-like protein
MDGLQDISPMVPSGDGVTKATRAPRRAAAAAASVPACPPPTTTTSKSQPSAAAAAAVVIAKGARGEDGVGEHKRKRPTPSAADDARQRSPPRRARPRATAGENIVGAPWLVRLRETVEAAQALWCARDGMFRDSRLLCVSWKF